MRSTRALSSRTVTRWARLSATRPAAKAGEPDDPNGIRAPGNGGQRCGDSSGGLGREVSWVLRSLTLPGAEYLMPVLFPPFVRDWGNAAARFLYDQGLRSGGAAESWRAYASLTESANRHAFVRTVRAVIDPGGQSVSATDRLYLTARIPTLIVWGARDSIIPVDHAYAAHEAIPGSRLEIIEGAGHFPHVGEPVRFAEVLTDFIRTTQPANTNREDLVAMLREGGPDR